MFAKAPATVISRLEKGICFGSLALLALVPFLEQILLRFNIPIQGLARDLVIHFFLVLVFSAAVFTTKSKGHIAISIAQYVRHDGIKRVLELASTLIIIFLLTLLAWNTLPFIRYGLAMYGSGLPPVRGAGAVPAWVFGIAMPLGYFAMAVRFFFGLGSWRLRIMGLAAILLGTFMALPAIAEMIWGLILEDVPEPFYSWIFNIERMTTVLQVPVIILLIIAALSGMPIFAAIAGIATVMLIADMAAPSALHSEVFNRLRQPSFIAIPLFTLAGFFLSESKAGERLVKTFQIFLGRLPGGIIIVAVLISAFFSSFTGASGVTILALGGILYTIFRKNGYAARPSIGLLTAAGGTGVMFPPSLAIIMVAVMSNSIMADMNVSAEYSPFHYFAGAIIPGLMLVLAMVIAGAVFLSKTKETEKASYGESAGRVFNAKEAFLALRKSLLEILLPVVVLLVWFFTARLEVAGAVAVIYAVVVEVFIKRDIAVRNIPAVFAKAIPVVGGVLIILAMASGLSYAFVLSGLPETFSEWMRDTVHSRFVFLLLLNVALLLVGTVVDMFSAIMVLLPLVVPLGVAYDINALHLGIIFILNLEAGFLTPPVGINLFLASSRFGKPVMQICRSVIPFFLVRLAVLLLVAYIPWFSTWLPNFLISRGF